jgi:hypothetical protein
VTNLARSASIGEGRRVAAADAPLVSTILAERESGSDGDVDRVRKTLAIIEEKSLRAVFGNLIFRASDHGITFAASGRE